MTVHDAHTIYGSGAYGWTDETTTPPALRPGPCGWLKDTIKRLMLAVMKGGRNSGS